jgi:hypothetical protein
VCVDCFYQGRLETVTVSKIPVVDYLCGYSGILCPLQSISARFIGNHQAYFEARYKRFAGINDSLQVAAAA